jgi:hypothetical protein
MTVTMTKTMTMTVTVTVTVYQILMETVYSTVTRVQPTQIRTGFHRLEIW